MATPTIRPPFAWLGRYSAIVSLLAVIIIGALFRFLQLTTLPPGVYDTAARLGLQSLNLVEHGIWPGLNATNGYAPLWVWLNALSIQIFGHTALALRIWPALLGTLAILTTWLWLRSWFSLRIAWITSFILAVTPWAVTLSRNGLETAAYPLLVSLTLWTATRAWRKANTGRYLVFVAAITIDLLAGPLGWLLATTSLITGLVLLLRTKRLMTVTRARLIAAAGLTVALAGLGYLLGTSFDAIKTLPQATGLVSSLPALLSNIVKTLLMFNVNGDENYRHNLAGEPMLNVFIGLMLIAGILVGISRLHERRYRLLFVFLIVMLVPAVVTNVGIPNAGRAVAALPIVLAFAAIGVSYMLELWYATFPVNSAARATGQAAIIVLLGLSAFQGYAQYFKAWAGSSEVYTAYNEGVVQMAHNLAVEKVTGQRYVVVSPDQIDIISYLDHKLTTYQPISVKDISNLPVAALSRQFTLSASTRDDAVKALKIKFPGGILRPHYSSFNQTEIYYTYEVTTK